MEDVKTPLSAPITPPPTQTPVVESPQPKKKTPIFKILVPILLIVILGLAGYIAVVQFEVLDMFTNSNPEQQAQEEEDANQDTSDIADSTEEDEEEEGTLFEGEYLTATVPSNWSIEEYFDGAGTEMLTGGVTFTGLTGLKIFKDTTEIFYLQAVYGIGFAGCSTYARFEDENPNYYAQILEDNEVSGTTAVVTDYTDTPYVEFEWLGKTFRRIDDYYNYDTVIGNDYFEPSCVPSLVTFLGLEFLPEDGPAATAYDYGLTNDATEADWLVVDDILQSMTLTD